MITIRPATTDADLEAWIKVRRAVIPYESAGTVAEHRARESEERLLLLAELDGELAGSGMADRSYMAGRFGIAPRVLPGFRRRGVGTAVLRELVTHAERFGVPEASALVDDEGSRAFAERFGFREVDRQVEQVKALGDEQPAELPTGIEVVTVAERPSLLEEAYPLACEGYADFATDAPASVSLEDWLREEATLPGGSFAAFAEGEVGRLQRLDGPRQPGRSRGRADGRAPGLAPTRPRTRAQGSRAPLGSAERPAGGDHLDPAR